MPTTCSITRNGTAVKIDLPPGGDYYRNLKKKNDAESERIIFALSRTLEHFNIATDKREVVAEALLRLSMVQSDQLRTAKDSETRALFSMLEYFQKEIGNE